MTKIPIEFSRLTLTSPMGYSAFVSVSTDTFASRAWFRRLRETGKVHPSGWLTKESIPDHVQQAVDAYFTANLDKLEALIPLR
jgi:hypothetical protein